MSTPRSKAVWRALSLALAWAVIIGGWEAAYRVIGWRPWIFPAPSHVLDAGLAMLNVHTAFGEPLGPGWPRAPPVDYDGERPEVGGLLDSPLLGAMRTTSLRLVIGFLASIVLGLGFGLLMWRAAYFDRLLGPVFLGLQTLPSVCWAPLAVLVFGINERGILFVLIMGSFFAMGLALRDGMRTVPPVYRTAGLMLGARRLALYRSVLLPASLPALAGMLRQGFSFAWRSLLGAELVLLAQRRGLGFLLHVGREFADIAQVVAVMVVMVVVGMLADRFVFQAIERKVRERFGLA